MLNFKIFFNHGEVMTVRHSSGELPTTTTGRKTTNYNRQTDRHTGLNTGHTGLSHQKNELSASIFICNTLWQ